MSTLTIEIPMYTVIRDNARECLCALHVLCLLRKNVVGSPFQNSVKFKPTR